MDRASPRLNFESGSLERQTLGEFLDWIAQRFDDRPALLYRPRLKTETWSYRRLHETAGLITAWLQSQGVGPGDRVILWAPNDPWWVAAFFGILKNGSILVPLDARSSPDFVERVVSQSEPKLAILSSALASKLPTGIPAQALETLADEISGLEPADFPAVSCDDLAEIVFTSGTTGSPKGVMLTHRNIRSNVEAINRVFPSGPQFKPLSILPLSHLLEQTCGLLLALRGGTSIAYASALQPAAIQRDMAEYRVTTMVLVPRILSLFMDSIERGVKKSGRERQWALAMRLSARLPMGARRILFRSVIQRFGGRLMFLVTGGGPLEPELERKWELLGIAVLQGYGATECSPIIAGTALGDRMPRSVGKPLPGTQLRIADDGEILITGPNVMKGYWRNADATAEVLDNGWYHTGDLGELDANGRLYLKGRKKNLIVLENGMNVFPEDVEEALGRQPGVAEALVMPMPSGYGPQIHAVLLCSETADLDALVKQANATLAPHQQVRSFERWPEADFPRTHTAKVKRPEVIQYVLANRRGEPAKAPEPTLQAARRPDMARILAEVLGASPDSVSDNSLLADLGLDLRARVALGRASEDRLGKFLDDSKIGPDTRVCDLASLLTSENPSGEPLYPLWPFSHGIQRTRSLLQSPMRMAERLLTQTVVTGSERLGSMQGPIIFVSDYAHLLDVPRIVAALPSEIRAHIGISTTWKDSHRNRLVGLLFALLFNSFRYSSSGSIHARLVHATGLLDHGWSVLFLLRERPTPDIARDESIELLACDFRIPIVPLEVRRGSNWRRLRIEIGDPVEPWPAPSEKHASSERQRQPVAVEV